MSSESSKEMTKSQDSPPCPYKERLFTCKYPESIGYEIIERMAAGEPVMTIARDDHMPALSQIFWWMQGTVEVGAAGVLSAYYAQARAVRADVVGNTVDFLIADQASEQPTRKHQNARVAMDGARWMLGRMGSTRWQEPTQRVEHKGHVSLSHMLEQVHGGQAGGTVLDSARTRVIEHEPSEPVDNQDK